MSRTITATRFKAECLGILDAVAATGEPVVVTKRGRPVARVVSAAEPDLLGSVTFLSGDDALMSTLDPWDAES